MVVLLFIQQGITAQKVINKTINLKERAEYEKAHPESIKPCKTCPKIADEGEEGESWREFANPNMPIPKGGIIKKAAEQSRMSPPTIEGPSRVAGQQWLGYTDPGFLIPPDTHGAVGLNEVITATNDFIIVHNKCGGAVLAQVTLGGFTGFFNVCDPYITFDPTFQRWIFSAISCGGTDNPVILMTSNTADPLGGWRQINWVTLPGTGVFLDHPYLGFDNARIIVSGRRFAPGFMGPSLFLIDKAAMYNGNAINFGINAQEIDRGTGDGDAPLPVTVYDPPFSNTGNPSPGTAYILQSWNNSSIRLSTVTGNIPAATWNTGAAVFPTTNLSSWNNGNIGNAARQTVETRLLAVNDARISCGVMMNGRIWAAHHITFPTSGTPDRVAVQWWQLDGTAGANFGNVMQNGRVGGTAANTYRWFPSIAVNITEDVLIGYSTSTNTTHVGAAYVTRQANTPANTTDDEVIYHGGQDRYWKAGTDGRARWGDYSHSALDPVDNSLWTIQEYAAPAAGAIPPDGNSRYGVWWAQVPQSMAIIGSGTVCGGTQSYSVSNLPAGATVVWTVSAWPAVTLGCSSCNVTTLSNPLSSIGTVTLTATVTTGCITLPPVTRQLWAGTPYYNISYDYRGQPGTPIAYYFGPGDENNVCQYANSTVATDVYGGGSATWSLISSNYLVNWSQGGIWGRPNDLHFYLWNANHRAVFRVQASNGCGTSTYDFGFKAEDCSGGGGGGCESYTVSPNPAKGTLNVIVPPIPPPCDRAPETKQGINTATIRSVRIFDVTGNIKLVKNFSNVKQGSVNIAGLMPGTYFVEITGAAGKKERHTVQVQ